MKRSKKKTHYATISAIISLVAVLIFLFLPAIVSSGSNPINITGFDTILGYKYTTSGLISISFDVLEFSFVMLLGLITGLLGTVLLFLSANKRNKTYLIIALISLIASSVIVFLTPNLVVFAENAALITFLGFNPQDSFNLAYGSIIAAILFIVSAVGVAIDLTK